MASIANDPHGRRRLIFKAPDGRWRTIRLGKVSKKAAGLIRSRLEAIVSARIASQPLDPDTTAWVASLPDSMHSKLAETGLFERRGVAKLGSFLRTILDECRSPLQRLTIALGRFAGLRIPSELVGLLWSEVNWERERFIVHAPKTERHGKGTRVVPIFPELAPLLREAWEAAPEGEDRIFPEITPTSNRRTWLGKLAARAGIEIWEKPWVNMRASAVTDAADKFPGHVCESWFGHSEAIGNRHYRQVNAEHFQKAITSECKPVDVHVPPDATRQRENPTDRTRPGRADTGDNKPGGAKSGARKDEKAAQNPARHQASPSSTESQETRKALAGKGLERLSGKYSPKGWNVCRGVENQRAAATCPAWLGGE